MGAHYEWTMKPNNRCVESAVCKALARHFCLSIWMRMRWLNREGEAEGVKGGVRVQVQPAMSGLKGGKVGGMKA